MNERRDLIQKLRQGEEQVQDLRKKVGDAQVKAKEKDGQLDDIRTRITVVAELFEKKPIKQKYSFEVLCDFIHDKAKRLFNKYENALKEKKAHQDDKVNYYHRKINQLEIENEKCKDAVSLLKLHVVPRVTALLSK